MLNESLNLIQHTFNKLSTFQHCSIVLVHKMKKHDPHNC